MSSCASELDKPPTRNNMGAVQIIELVAMGVVAILCGIDFFNMLNLKHWDFFVVLALIIDGLIIVGLVFIIIGLFFNGGLRKIQIGLYCFFGGAIIDVVIIVYFLIKFSDEVGNWLVNLFKAILLAVLAYFLWRQAKNI